jgi:hypothetical protein
MGWVDYRSFETDCQLPPRAIGDGGEPIRVQGIIGTKLDSVTPASAL